VLIKIFESKKDEVGSLESYEYIRWLYRLPGIVRNLLM